jgi:hypothetical protein
MPDFGFVGTSYVAPSIYQGDQECINFFAEIDTSKQAGERGIVALYPTPGLVEEVQLFPTEVRGLYTMSGETILIAVAGNRVYQVNTSFVATQIGTLTTNTGQVSISDNIDHSNWLDRIHCGWAKSVYMGCGYQHIYNIAKHRWPVARRYCCGCD